MDFSLFYFADAATSRRDPYRLLMAGARFADEHGLAAVWTPERHFHSFGGLYPNPAVTGAAIAAITKRVGIRAGSVVAPLNHPIRIAEEWSVLDNLSAGRTGISFASGWHATDFVLMPDAYAARKKVLIETVESVRQLWRGASLEFGNGTGERVQVRIFPPPVQPEPPMWLTSAGSPETFKLAGSLGLGVLTHLLGQDLDVLKRNIAIYRSSFTPRQDPPSFPHVTLMLHTYLGLDRLQVREEVRTPFSNYLRSSIDLIMKASGEFPAGYGPADLSPEDKEFLVSRSFDRYFATSGLFGTVHDGMKLLEAIEPMDINELACLIDFGVATDDVLSGLRYLDALNRAWAKRLCRLGEAVAVVGRSLVRWPGQTPGKGRSSFMVT